MLWHDRQTQSRSYQRSSLPEDRGGYQFKPFHFGSRQAPDRIRFHIHGHAASRRDGRSTGTGATYEEQKAGTPVVTKRPRAV